MTPERLAEIRQRDASGEFSLTTAADRRELLAFLDESLAHACILQAEADRLRAAVKFQRECNEDTGRIAERAEAEADRLRAQMGEGAAEMQCCLGNFHDAHRWIFAREHRRCPGRQGGALS